jgi:leader peptidase (prepilin peptidase) / N-methyltransferase
MQVPLSDIELPGTIFAALLGLAFGSFLNVCLTRLPQGESIAVPRSHCRDCTHTLAWWENLPLLSWLILRGRCRQCHARIGLRYPLVELAVSLLWTACWLYFDRDPTSFSLPDRLAPRLILIAGFALLCWLLVALAALDAEHYWLPDRLTLPGIALGFVFSMLLQRFHVQRCCINYEIVGPIPAGLPKFALYLSVEILLAAGVILIIRLAYWLVRRKEGMGLGDAKLMAMLGAWLGLVNALESFALAVSGAALTALVWLMVLALRGKSKKWAHMPLPLGTFLCIAAFSEIFYPGWLWAWYSHRFLP